MSIIFEGMDAVMQIIAAVTGGIIAGAVGWFVQYRMEKVRLDRVRNLFTVVVTDDLKNSINLYDLLIEDWRKSKTVWFRTINEFSDSRDIYYRNKDWITLISDQELRRKILQYYRRSGNHLTQLQNAQQRVYDIQRNYRELVRGNHLDRAMAEDEAEREAVKMMANEAKELADLLDSLLPSLVNQLIQFRADADSIQKELENL
jgi:site-specific DNA-adenine methylase